MKSRLVNRATARLSFLPIYVLLLFSFLSQFTASQEILVSGEASNLMSNPRISRPQYEEETYQIAVNFAIDKAFGSSVMSNYERFTSTEMQGRSVAGYSDIRNNYLNTYPNGIWIQDKSRRCYEEKDEKGNWWMTCKVTGLARKIDASEVRFISRTLDGTDPMRNRTETFNNGESGYLYFRSAEDGYLIVFYDDLNTVQRCIPYNAMTEHCLKVSANQEYIFFSTELSGYLNDKILVDEIEFFTELPFDYNQFYIVFSPEPFRGYFLNPPEKLEDGYITFKSMEKESFHTWLQANRIRNKDLQVQIIGVTIRGVK